MEPFGILRFLQAMQALAPTPASDEKQKPSPTPPSQTDEKPPQNGEENTQTASSLSQDGSPAQNAVLGFLQAHDERAKRTKKETH